MRSAASLLTLTLACTPSPSGDDEAMTDTGTDTSSDTDTGTDTETGAACELPENATPSETASLSIVNNRDVAIYVIPYSSFFCNYGQVERSMSAAPQRCGSTRAPTRPTARVRCATLAAPTAATWG